jgi:hypothetical protein
MAGNVPPKPSVDQIIWFEARLPMWSATPTAFGATAAAVTALSAQVLSARKAYDAAQAARVASKNATMAETAAVNSMLGGGRALVNTMKSFIEAAHNETLWSQSGLSPDAPPGPAPDPVAPYTMTASLDVDGNVILNWKTSQPAGLSGISYSIRRALNEGAFVLLDTVGGKTFTDETVPVGTQSVSYTIKARHGTQSSDWSPAFTVRFGRAGGGGMAIVGTETTPMKMAA